MLTAARAPFGLSERNQIKSTEFRSESELGSELGSESESDE